MLLIGGFRPRDLRFSEECTINHLIRYALWKCDDQDLSDLDPSLQTPAPAVGELSSLTIAAKVLLRVENEARRQSPFSTSKPTVFFKRRADATGVISPERVSYRVYRN